jgi:predicted esterase
MVTTSSRRSVVEAAEPRKLWEENTKLWQYADLAFDVSGYGTPQYGDLYLPDGDAPSAGWAVVAVVHGLSSSKESFKKVCKKIAVRGKACFSVEYMYGDRRIPDVRASVQFLVDNRGTYNINKDRITLFGSSLGSTIVTQIMLDGIEYVNGAVLASGVYKNQAEAAHAKMQPVLIMHCTNDYSMKYEFAAQLHENLQGAGAPSEMITCKDGHLTAGVLYEHPEYIDEVVQFADGLPPFKATAMIQDTTEARKSQRSTPTKMWQGSVKLWQYADLAFDVDGYNTPQYGDLYVPDGEAPSAGWPVIAVVHGLGSSKESFKKVCKLIVVEGTACFSVEYAYGDRRIPDVRAAAEFLVDQHAQYSLDSTRITYMGSSLGSTIVTEIMLDGSEHVNGAILAAGVYKRQAEAAHANMKPVMIMHCTNDYSMEYEHAKQLDKNLKLAGASSEMVTCDDGHLTAGVLVEHPEHIQTMVNFAASLPAGI